MHGIAACGTTLWRRWGERESVCVCGISGVGRGGCDPEVSAAVVAGVGGADGRRRVPVVGLAAEGEGGLEKFGGDGGEGNRVWWGRLWRLRRLWWWWDGTSGLVSWSSQRFGSHSVDKITGTRKVC